MIKSISIGLVVALLGAGAGAVAMIEHHDAGVRATAELPRRVEVLEHSSVESSTRISTLETRTEVSIKDREDIHRELSEYKRSSDKRLERIEDKLDKIADAVGAKK